MHKFDLAIVGGGVLGTFHAFHAAQAGLKVAVFERTEQQFGSSVRNFGQVVPSGLELNHWHEYGQRSLLWYQKIQSLFPITVRNQGSTYIASDELELQVLRELCENFKEFDYHSEFRNKDQTLQDHPYLKHRYVHGSLKFKQEISVEPLDMIHQLQAFIKKKFPVKFFHKHAVLNIEECGRINTNRNEVFEAEQVIVCNGYEFQLLYPELFEQSNMRISKLQMLLTNIQPSLKLIGNILTGESIRRYESFTSCPSYIDMKRTTKNLELELNGIHILFKQAVDGSIILGDSHHYTSAALPNSLGFQSNDEIDSLILDAALKIMNLQDCNIKARWQGFYCQEDQNKIFHKQVSPVVQIVTGIGGKGMTASCGYSEANIARMYANKNTYAGLASTIQVHDLSSVTLS